MSLPRNKTHWLVWGGLGLTIVAIIVAFVRNEKETGAARGLLLPIRLPVPEFALTNQLGQVVTLKDLLGQVWVADIIFTRCAGPCPRMTGQMSELQAALTADKSVKLVTLTTDPDFDTSSVLKRYAERFKADSSRWHFLTGSKGQIADLAVNGLKLVTMEKEPDKRESENDLFIHSQLFVVVDKHGLMRASIESNEPGANARVLQVVQFLLKEH